MPPPIIAIHAAICLILDIQNVTFSLVIESNQILDSYNYVKHKHHNGQYQRYR